MKVNISICIVVFYELQLSKQSDIIRSLSKSSKWLADQWNICFEHKFWQVVILNRPARHIMIRNNPERS